MKGATVCIHAGTSWTVDVNPDENACVPAKSAGCLGSYCVRDERAERRRGRVSVGPFDDWWGFGFESVSETESRSLSSYMATLHITLIMNRFDRQLKVSILVEASDFLLEA